MATISAEIRWFWPASDAALTADVERWFAGRHLASATRETRVDTYLVNAHEKELGIKTRGAAKGLEIKGWLGRSAPLATGVLSGPVQLWAKWTSASLAFAGTGRPCRISKERWIRRFDAGVTPVAHGAGEPRFEPAGELALGCHVERTHLGVEDSAQRWWTMGLEAFGGWPDVDRVLRETAQLLQPGAPDLARARVLSYPEWLAELVAS